MYLKKREKPLPQLWKNIYIRPEALQNQEYLLCLDAANAALKLNKGNADALFYQQAASAFAAAGIHASGMRTALDRADAAMEANDFSDMQKAEHFREYLIGYLSVPAPQMCTSQRTPEQ